MSVDFQEAPSMAQAAKPASGPVVFLIQTGIVKDAAGANAVLLALTVISFTAIVYLWTTGFINRSPGVTPEDRVRLEATTPLTPFPL